MRMPTAGEPAVLHCGDCIEFLGDLPDDSLDLLFTSPPYEAARSYAMGFTKAGEEWVAWMAAVVRAAAPKVKGLIAVNCDGQTRDFRYSCVPFLLMADLHRAGFNLRKPPVYRRVGIPGSGGPDWLRSDYEPVVCVTRPGRLPWSDNTACGHPPKWAPGGAMSHRVSDGTRVNQWGGHPKSSQQRRRDGSRQPSGRPSHQFGAKAGWAPNGTADGDLASARGYEPPTLANPGNLVSRTYTAEEVADLFGEPPDVLDCNVGGNRMGHPLAHQNEAPFPLELPEFFVRSFCPPGGIVADCFLGSGTTAHAAKKWGRLFAGCDLRQSQVDLARRRLASVPTELFV